MTWTPFEGRPIFFTAPSTAAFAASRIAGSDERRPVSCDICASILWPFTIFTASSTSFRVALLTA